jgi:hypothetical protein
VRPSSTSTVTPRQQRQRQQWRVRSAKMALRISNPDPNFPRSPGKKNRIKQFKLWLSELEVQAAMVAWGVIAEHGRDDVPMPDDEYHTMVEATLTDMVKTIGKTKGRK